ncbi:hypothetical protein Ae201684P_018230 [Aphanomyces euteiches]|nr:hypothetical protein Ae201684P_018230 [Aphanomyces euteiches]
MTAVIAGNVEVVRLLVENMAHMDVQDEDGKTCLDLVNECKQETSRNEIKSLLQSEEQKRASSVDFRDEYVKTYLSMTQTEALVQGGFSKVVNCSPEFARTFLDDYVEVHRHNFKFSQVGFLREKCKDECAILNLKFEVEGSQSCHGCL